MTQHSLERQGIVSEKPVILVVDDDPAFTLFVTATLRSTGYAVLSASNGEDGLRLMRQHKPALVILDVMMSHLLEGVGVAQQMSDDDELRRIPVLMVSAIANTEYLGHFPTEGYLNVDDFLTKPFGPGDLVERVRRLTAGSSLPR